MRTYYNWENKEERALKAQEHTKEMTTLYEPEIQRSIAKSHIFRDTPELLDTKAHTISVVATDTVSAAFDCEGKTVVLNFASYKNPGGRFIDGSRAQEECLCHESFLYNVLKEFPDYYEKNKLDLNKGLYRNAAIYSENVLFEHDGKVKELDVLTCASPNKTAAQKYQNVSNAENSKVLDERIQFIIHVLNQFNTQNVILGAFGCGVFGQDPYEVAKLFKKYLPYLKPANVVFAVIDTTSTNYKAFEEVFN